MKYLRYCDILLVVFIIIFITTSGCSPTNQEESEDPTLILNPFFLPDGFEMAPYAEELILPTSIAFPPDGSNRLFVNELQTGSIKIVEDGNVLAEPFARINTFAAGNFPEEGENGVIGITFDPDYINNRYVYVSYAVRELEDTVGVIARFKDVNNRGEDFTIILDSIPSAVSHQIQSIRFGPDGKLYAAVSDAYEPEQAQDTSNLNGTILRINPDGSIPADNPFGDSYIYAYGFRNCFDFTFMPDGRLIASDIGAIFEDELNIVEAGGNYAWPRWSGKGNQPPFIDPVHVWFESVSPTGIAFYQHGLFPEPYQDKLFIVLFGQTYAEGPSDRSKRIQYVDWNGPRPVLKDFMVYNIPTRGNPLDIAFGPDGNLYFSDIFRGKVFRITYHPN